MKNQKSLLYLLLLSLIAFAFSSCSNPAAEENQTTSKKDTAVVVDTSPLPDLQFAAEDDSLKGITFQVDEVVQNKELFETFPAKAAIANFIGKNLTFSPDHDSVGLIPLQGNGLVRTIYLCYAQHRPLVLSPDAIWMTISQGVSTHINKNFKKLESQLFTANKPKEIEVRNDSLDYGAKYWQQLIGSLSDSTRKYTQKDMYAFFAPKFSTTTQQIFTAYEANILYAYKKAFTYIGGAGCGIPYITITGTKEDWMLIKEKLIQLDKLGLEYWRKELEPVIDEFIAVFENKRDPLFWKNIIKEYSDYGAFYISGWIIKFFPYKEVLTNGVDDPQTGEYRLEHDFEKNEYIEGDKYLLSTLSMDDFPTYKSEATIIYKNYFRNETTHMFLYSGIMAARQYPDGSLKPWVTWGICSEKEKKAKSLYNKHGELVHRDPDWVPTVIKDVASLPEKPIYQKGKGLGYEESMEEFKKDLMAFLGPKSGYQNDTLTFYILANGKPLFITKNKKQEMKIQGWLDKTGIQWTPGKIELKEIMMMGEPINSDALVPVNCSIELILEEK